MKRIITVVASVLCMAMLFTACGKSKSTENGEIDWSEYVTLGEYKGVKVSKDTVVTEEEVEAQIKQELANDMEVKEVTDRPVKDGDTVNIDYAGYHNDVAFDGGTAQAQELVIGSNTFIDGFESGLIGAKIGEEVTLEVTFPDPYQNAELAGEDAEFKVKVNSIQESIYPELTDAYVSEHFEVATAEEYRQNIRKSLEEQKQTDADEMFPSSVWGAVLAQVEVKKYPQDEIDKEVSLRQEYYENMAKEENLTLEEYLTQQGGITVKEFEEQLLKSAEALIKEQMVSRAIAQAESITLTDEEYQTKALEYAKNYEKDTVEAFEEAYGKKEISDLIIWDKVVEFLIEEAQVKEN